MRSKGSTAGGKKPKLQVRNPRPEHVVNIFESDESANFLIGSPGYRNARNRSGLGYFETVGELSRIQGIIIKSLFAGQFHITQEPSALISMIILSIFWGVIPCTLIIVGYFFDKSVPIFTLLITGFPNMLIGIFVSISASMSIMAWPHKKSKGKSKQQNR